MPLYEYECEACGQRFEVIRKFSDAPLTTCSLCGKGPVEKLLSSPAIQFKGAGWYVTDYARKDKGDAGKKDAGSKGASKDAGSAKSEGGGDSKPADTKKAGSGKGAGASKH
jgi:putative FmdB family regulatory protein